MALRTVAWAEQPAARKAWAQIVNDAWPEFLTHDPVWQAHDHLLSEVFPEYQFVLVDGDAVVAGGNCIPFTWNDHTPLPDGIDGVLLAAAEAHAAGTPPNAASALQIVVRADRLGQGLSRRCIETMGRVVTDQGLTTLVAPVRPTLKDRYPLIPLERYARWRRADGQLFDPWLRTHERLGAQSLGVCPGSMTIRGTADEWETWTGLTFPEPGRYVVAGGLVPVEFDAAGIGVYTEPNFWMCHRPGSEAG